MQAGFFAATRRTTTFDQQTRVSEPIQPELRQNVIYTHAIPKLMEDAEAQFRKKVSKQSQTLSAAVTEYKRRYKRPPPRGFDKWWSFAQKNSVLLVDEYDGLVDDLAPFWQLSGEEFRRRAVQAS